MLKSPSSLLKLEDIELIFWYVRWESTSLGLACPSLQTWRMITVLRWLQGSNEAVLWRCLLNGLEIWLPLLSYVQFSSVAQLCLTICDPMNHSTPGLPVHHQLPEFTQTHVHWVSDAILPSHPLSSPSLPALNLSQHQGLFKWVSSLHQVAKVLEFHLQHQSFQWTPRTDLL